jgi:hypothetical protein
VAVGGAVPLSHGGGKRGNSFDVLADGGVDEPRSGSEGGGSRCAGLGPRRLGDFLAPEVELVLAGGLGGAGSTEGRSSRATPVSETTEGRPASPAPSSPADAIGDFLSWEVFPPLPSAATGRGPPVVLIGRVPVEIPPLAALSLAEGGGSHLGFREDDAHLAVGRDLGALGLRRVGPVFSGPVGPISEGGRSDECHVSQGQMWTVQIASQDPGKLVTLLPLGRLKRRTYLSGFGCAREP